MSRPLRVNIADGWYHVMHRGIERRRIFSDDRDRAHFVELLSELPERFRFRIHAFVEMHNHYHAIVQTPDANLSEGMQWLHLGYATWFNIRHDRVGPLFQGRFKSVPIENGAWAYELSVYVHLNPLHIAEFRLSKREKQAEGLGWREPTREEVTSRLQRLRSYAWSSYRAYGNYCGRPRWLHAESLLEQTGERAGLDQARAYRERVKQRLTKGVEESALERLRDGIAVGSEAFRSRIKELAGDVSREVTGKCDLRRRVVFREVVRCVEQVRGEDFQTFCKRRGDWGRPMVMWLARRYCGLTLREIGDQMGAMDYAAVSIALKRWEIRSKGDKTLRKLRKNVTDMLSVET